MDALPVTRFDLIIALIEEDRLSESKPYCRGWTFADITLDVESIFVGHSILENCVTGFTPEIVARHLLVSLLLLKYIALIVAHYALVSF